jgi:UDP-GlcNAc:undecaprenyl-phosphate GlcNAc-1-phosphate transferase
MINLFFTALILSVIFILALIPCALKLGFIDHPCSRKQHDHPTPPIGGLVIYLSSVSTLWFYVSSIPHLVAFTLGLTLLTIVGVIDDHKEISVKIRLSSQIFAALIMAEMAGIKITQLGDLFGNGIINLNSYSTVLTVFAVVGGINAFNMIDGIDGLCGSSALVAISLIALLALFFNNALLLNISLIYIGCIVAFLLFNLPIFGRTKAAIFLGDSGSTLLGYVVCWLIISASQTQEPLITPTLVLWLIAIPLYDSICIMLRRLLKGQSPFIADREHLHHLLPLKGISISNTLIISLALSTAISFAALIASLYFEVRDCVLFSLFLIGFAGFCWFMHSHFSLDLNVKTASKKSLLTNLKGTKK